MRDDYRLERKVDRLTWMVVILLAIQVVTILKSIWGWIVAIGYWVLVTTVILLAILGLVSYTPAIRAMFPRFTAWMRSSIRWLLNR